MSIKLEDHEYIMGLGKALDKSASQIIAEWVYRHKGEIEGNKPEVVLYRKYKEYDQPYYLSEAQLREVMQKVPSGICPIKPEVKKGADRDINNLAEGVEMASSGHGLNATYIRPNHIKTIILAFLSGNGTDSLPSEFCIPVLNAITDYTIDVKEVNSVVFVPINDTGKKICEVITLCHERRLQKEYFSPADLTLLWRYGYIINYV